MKSAALEDAGAPAQPRMSSATARPGFGATDVMLFMMALIWGANFTVVKYGTQAVAPLAFNGVRMLLASTALAVLAYLWTKDRPTRRDVIVLLALGVLGNGLYQLLFVEGISRTRPADAALVIAASPAFIALLGRLTGVERITTRGAIGVALSIAGVAFVVVGAPQAGGGQMQSSLLGNALVLGGSLCWAVYTILLKPYTHRIDGIQLSAVTMIGGTVPMLLVAAPDIAATDWSALPSLAWGAVAYAGLAALVLAYLFWYRGVRVIGPTRTAMYANLQPAIAMVIAWLAFGDRPGVVQLAGIAVITTGLLLTRS